MLSYKFLMDFPMLLCFHSRALPFLVLSQASQLKYKVCWYCTFFLLCYLSSAVSVKVEAT